jgi:hypothetical protein
LNSEGFRETLSEEWQKEPREDKMAENNAGREEQPEERPEEETSSREDTMDSEGTIGEVQRIEARLRGVTQPSVEKPKEALREEVNTLEERFLARNTRKNGDDTGRRLEDDALAEPGGILEGPRDRKKLLMGADQKAEKAFMCRMWTTH